MANGKLAERLNKDCDISVVASRYFQSAKYGTFICPKCGSGSGRHATGMSIDTERNKIHCFACGTDWSVIDVILHCESLSDHGKDFIEALKIGCQIYGLYFEENKFTPTSAKDDFDDLDATAEKIKADIIDAKKHIDELPLKDRRGLTIDTFKHFGVGYFSQWTHPKLEGNSSKHTPRLIIPTSDSSYNAILLKSARTDANQKFKSMNAGKKQIFNSAAIVPDEIVIVVEGEIDAMSIFQATGGNVNVVATGGAAQSNLTNFFSTINSAERLNYKILILFDSDETGRTNAKKLTDELVKLGIPATSKFFTDENSKLDANDILINEGDAALNSRVEQILAAAQIELEHAKNILSTLPTLQETPKTGLLTLPEFSATDFDAAVTNYRKFFERKSGFKNLDAVTIWNPGLYVLGAIPGAGKTTFCWQLLEQFANQGEHCIFCSYELSLAQLAAKSYARQLFIQDSQTTLSATDILRGATSSTLQQILADYKCGKFSSSLAFLEFSTENVDDLLSLIKPYCNNKPPIVCIDYLQIIPASTDKSISDKQRLDDIVRKLKVFQRETNTTFIVVSSFNRLHYNVSASMESFKESGNIEYSADVLLALELWQNSTDNKSLRELMKCQPRLIQLKCLKNRFGAMFDVFFEYFPKHDYFQPANDFDVVQDDSADVKR